MDQVVGAGSPAGGGVSTRPPRLAWGEGLARALVEHSADVILVLDADHHCRFANPAVRDRLGYAPEEVLGQDVIPLHHPEDLPRAGAMLAEAAANPGRPAETEVRLRHRDGSWRWMAVVATNGLRDPAVRGIVCNLRDVTERTEAALATEAALRAQETARRDLEQAVRAKGDFLRLVSHEFKTPLTAIAGYAELLELAPDDREQILESARVIRDEAKRLARLTQDVLLLDRMEATQLVLRRERLDLNALATRVVGRLRGLAPHREFLLDLAEGLPAVSADPERIEQVVINLVGNAVKYSPGGEPITVATAAAGDGVRLSVVDRGIGIPADVLPFVFERYRRVESGATAGIEGSGLGLAIVREIARLHGGRAWAESVEGEGSTFHVDLPLDGGRG